MDFTAFSEQERTAEISGKGYPAPSSGSHHNFALVVHSRQVWVPGRSSDGGGDGPAGALTNVRTEKSFVPTWQWTVSGYRRLDESLTIDGKTYETWHPAPGEFGYVGTHDDPTHELSYELTGGGLKQLADGVFELKVPHNGSVKINTKVAVGPAKPKPTPSTGCLGALLAFLAAIVAAVKKLFK
jgi:hypothetical protein